MPILADEVPTNATPREAVGLSLGWVVANGLSYRRYSGNTFVQATFAGAIDKERDQQYVDASISYGHYLNTFDFGRGRFPIGIKWITGLEFERDLARSRDLVATRINNSPNEIHIGTGVGFDLGNPNHRGMIYSIDVIYTATFRDLKDSQFVRLGILPSVSLHYNL